MPFPWINVPNAAGRGSVERNSIALTSRLAQGLHVCNTGWLGHHATVSKCAQACGTSNYVHHRCDPGFLDLFEQLADREQRVHCPPPCGMSGCCRLPVQVALLTERGRLIGISDYPGRGGFGPPSPTPPSSSIQLHDRRASRNSGPAYGSISAV